jgi:glycosyltransferase involved in cell wall biosynthesis
VIASDIPPVREVCGEIPLYFDPRSPDQLAGAMRALLNESNGARQARIRRGADRAASFTWERSARQLAEFCRTELLGR